MRNGWLCCVHHEQDRFAGEGQHQGYLDGSPEGPQQSTEKEFANCKLFGIVQPIPALNSGALLGMWLKGAKNWKRSGKTGNNFQYFL